MTAMNSRRYNYRLAPYTGSSAQKGYLFQASGLWKGNKSSRSMNEMPKVVPDDIYVMNVLRYANINQMVYGQK